MLKTILIDDEDLIREGLRTAINWQEMGFEIVGEAADGEQAISLIQEVKPDVIITDIRMPFMNGLELIEFIKPMLPDTYIVIISGHDEFHYAQKALQLGVFDFILKPFDLDYFKKMLLRIKYEYTLKKKTFTSPLPADDLLRLQSNFIELVMTNKIDKVQIPQKMIDYNLQGFDSRYFSIVLIQVDNFNMLIADYTLDQINEFQKDFMTLLETSLNPTKKLFIIEGNVGDTFLCIHGSSPSEVEMKRDKVTAQIRSTIDLNSSYSVTIANSSHLQGITQLYRLYKQAHEVCAQRFILGYNQNLSYKDLTEDNSPVKNRSNYPQIGFDRIEFMTLIKSGGEILIGDYMDRVFENLIQHGHNSSLYVTMFVSSVYMELLNYLNKYDFAIDDIFDDPLLLYKQLTLSQNIYNTKELVKELATKVATYVLAQSTNTYDSRIQEAIVYIDTHFTSPDITLQKVAEHVNMGVCYFSSTFKKETGDAFINYLTSLRINKAKELFETSNYKSYEISYMVGYNTPTYFSTLFKKIIGVSPSDYKNYKLNNE